jgi:Mrp family chromosome partitioning ATPase
MWCFSDLHRLGTLLKDLNVTDELLTPLSAPSTRPLIMALPSDLHVDIPPPLRASIYVRPSYWTALRKIREAVREAPEAGVVLTGSPGVGKSAFAMLLVAHLAQQGGVVIYHYTGSFCEWLVLFDFRGQQVKVEMQPYSEVRLFSWVSTTLATLLLAR